jgi:hypothetical protein
MYIQQKGNKRSRENRMELKSRRAFIKSLILTSDVDDVVAAAASPLESRNSVARCEICVTPPEIESLLIKRERERT